MNIGEHYLVDLGRLVPARATSARAAYTLAVLSVYGESAEPPERVTVYHVAADGEIEEVAQ